MSKPTTIWRVKPSQWACIGAIFHHFEERGDRYYYPTQKSFTKAFEESGVLSDREKNVLRMRFGLDDKKRMTLEAIGKKFGVGIERIRQVEARALRKCKNPRFRKILYSESY